ncbi:UDP-N-acetylmuramoyl-L-alanyl-D-glutamate--2,6-diaminopimelate ligase [Luteolibacter algae]|uniref:UDP-N-acetylmuramoyl-L-alanyl-D-glutamate--2,6-diaminopimelate ligase n=1 Tax=Luteolibacter algae TaxID=454151 RepID=A0ABW5D7W4_9BACT
MLLRTLISDLDKITTSGNQDVEISALTADSRAVTEGMLFAAIRGTSLDGHRFIDEVISKGATAILAEIGPPTDLPDTVAWLHVPDSRSAIAKIAAAFYEEPAGNLKLAGVTGTNGKTTIAFLIHHIMQTEWHRAGLLSTVLVDDGEERSPAKHTTPGSIELHKILATFRDNACRGGVMEVSSHGIDQKRVHSVAFDAAIFTNLTQDHLDYHVTIERYMAAKASWFHDLAANKQGKKPTAVINTDDARGNDLAKSLDGKMPVIRYGFNVNCDFRAGNFQQKRDGMSFELSARGKTFLVRSPLIGRFNAYNLLAAIAGAAACGIKPRQSIAALADSPQVPGRMQNVGNAGGATVFVDYAHTPDALENACRTLRELDPRRLITVFGCGGDRDKAKRPLMAAAAAQNSDALILTSDNPRSEDPNAIIADMVKGLPPRCNYLTIPDRAEAIDAAMANSRSGDIVLIAGKGHETYQEFSDHTIDFDDRKKADLALRKRALEIAEMRSNPENRF